MIVPIATLRQHLPVPLFGHRLSMLEQVSLNMHVASEVLQVEHGGCIARCSSGGRLSSVAASAMPSVSGHAGRGLLARVPAGREHAAPRWQAQLMGGRRELVLGSAGTAAAGSVRNILAGWQCGSLVPASVAVRCRVR